MKKKLASVTLLLTTALATAGCDSDEVTLKQNDGKSIVFKIENNGEKIYYYADDLLNDLQETSSAKSTLYSEVSRQVFTQYALNTLDSNKVDSIRTEAKDQVTEFKDDCKSSASDEGTDYDDYLETALAEKGVETTKELEELFFYQGLKSAILDDYIEDKNANNANYNYFLNKYLANYTPYQVKHILVAANSADTKYKDGTMSVDNARKLVTIMNRFINGENFEEIALITEDTSSAQNGGVMPFNEAQNYVSEFRFATYVQEVFQNIPSTATNALDSRYNQAVKLHLISDDNTSDDYVSKDEFEESNLYQVYKNGVGTVALADIMELTRNVASDDKGAYNYYNGSVLKTDVEEISIGDQPYEMNVSKFTDDGDLNEKYFEEYELARNQVFNKTLNCHQVQYIEVDKTDATYANTNTVKVSVYDDVSNAYVTKDVLSDESGNPIFVALASTGIHFMAMVWNTNDAYNANRVDASGVLADYTSTNVSTEALESLSNLVCSKKGYTVAEGKTALETALAEAGDYFNQYLNEAYFTLFDTSDSDLTKYQYTYIGQHGDYKNKSKLTSNSDSLLGAITSYASNLEYHLFDAIVYQSDSKLEASNFAVSFNLEEEGSTKIYDMIKDYVQDKLTSTDESFQSSVKSAAETYADKLMREKEVKEAAEGTWLA